MSTAPPANVIWQRTIDRDHQRARWRRLLLWYVAPVVVIAIVLAVALGPWSALGFVILTGAVGAMLALWLGLTNLNERSGATIRFDGRHLGFRQHNVDVQSVASYSTYSGKIRSPIPLYSAMVYGTSGSSIDCGYAKFRTADGNMVEFLWPNMPPDQVDGVRQALDRVLPGRWQPMADL